MNIDFSSLNFEKISDGVETASVKVPNGYTILISRGRNVAHTYGAPYEVTMSPIRNEILEEPIGYLSEKEVKQIINEVSNLPKLKNS